MAKTYEISNRLVIMAIDLVEITEDDEGVTEDYESLEKFNAWLEKRHIWYDEDGTFDLRDSDDNGSVEYAFQEKDLPKIEKWLSVHGITKVK